jgi:hypothetical protein
MKIVKDIFDVVFSFAGFMTVFAILVLLIFSALIKQENAKTALTKATIKACYDGGLIKVDTDAGFYCVAPANLVKVEVK